MKYATLIQKLDNLLDEIEKIDVRTLSRQQVYDLNKYLTKHCPTAGRKLDDDWWDCQE